MQSTTANAIVGAKVAKLRDRDGLSQAQLAEALARKLGKERMDPTSITRLEKGTRPTTVDELFALSQIFNTPAETLLPEPGLIADALRQVTEKRIYWQTEERRIEFELRQVKERADIFDCIETNLEILHKYMQAGDKSGNKARVADALRTLVRTKYGTDGSDMLPPDSMPPLTELLGELGVPKDIISEASHRTKISDTNEFSPIDAVEIICAEFFGEDAQPGGDAGSSSQPQDSPEAQNE